MTATKKMIDLDSLKRSRGSMRLARAIIQITALAATFTLGVTTGSRHKDFVEVPRAWTSLNDERSDQMSPGGLLHEAEEPGRVSAADELLTQLDLHLRQLLAHQRQIESSAKEDRIAYNLLRMRGYKDDSIECQRLINRQKQFDVTATQVDARIAEARQLQRRLHEILDTAAGATQLEIGAPDQLIADIQRWLSHNRPVNRNEHAIPDERWSGGPDLLMTPNQPGHEHNPDIGEKP